MSTDPTLHVQHVENNQGAAQDEAEGGARGYKRSRRDAAGNQMATRTSSRRQQGEAPLQHGEGIHTNEQGDGISDDGNDDDDDPVETPATGAGGGGAPSRVTPFPGIGRVGQGGQFTTPATGAGGGGAPSRVNQFAGVGRGGQGGDYNQSPRDGVNNGVGPLSRGANQFAGNVPGR